MRPSCCARALGSSVLLFSDVRVKHSRPLGGPSEDLVPEAREAVGRGLADALILSGGATGSPPEPADFERVKKALPEIPLLVGSGVDRSNLELFWPVADGMIVGSATKENGDARAAVNPQRAREILQAASSLRRVRGKSGKD